MQVHYVSLLAPASPATQLQHGLAAQSFLNSCLVAWAPPNADSLEQDLLSLVQELAPVARPVHLLSSIVCSALVAGLPAPNTSTASAHLLGFWQDAPAQRIHIFWLDSVQKHCEVICITVDQVLPALEESVCANFSAWLAAYGSFDAATVRGSTFVCRSFDVARALACDRVVCLLRNAELPSLGFELSEEKQTCANTVADDADAISDFYSILSHAIDRLVQTIAQSVQNMDLEGDMDPFDFDLSPANGQNLMSISFDGDIFDEMDPFSSPNDSSMAQEQFTGNAEEVRDADLHNAGEPGLQPAPPAPVLFDNTTKPLLEPGKGWSPLQQIFTKLPSDITEANLAQLKNYAPSLRVAVLLAAYFLANPTRVEMGKFIQRWKLHQRSASFPFTTLLQRILGCTHWDAKQQYDKAPRYSLVRTGSKNKGGQKDRNATGTDQIGLSQYGAVELGELIKSQPDTSRPLRTGRKNRQGQKKSKAPKRIVLKSKAKKRRRQRDSSPSRSSSSEDSCALDSSDSDENESNIDAVLPEEASEPLPMPVDLQPTYDQLSVHLKTILEQFGACSSDLLLTTILNEPWQYPIEGVFGSLPESDKQQAVEETLKIMTADSVVLQHSGYYFMKLRADLALDETANINYYCEQWELAWISADLRALGVTVLREHFASGWRSGKLPEIVCCPFLPSTAASKFFKVAPSRLTGAGNGLFAERDIPLNLLLSYTGELLNETDYPPNKVFPYGVRVSTSTGSWIINGLVNGLPSCIAACINDARDAGVSQTHFTPLDNGSQPEAYVSFVAAVSAGQEVYLNYGVDYPWDAVLGSPLQSAGGGGSLDFQQNSDVWQSDNSLFGGLNLDGTFVATY